MIVISLQSCRKTKGNDSEKKNKKVVDKQQKIC